MAKTYITIPEKMLMELAERKCLKEYAFYINLRSQFLSGVIYKYTVAKVSQITKTPHTTVWRHMKHLQEFGLVHKRDGNLCCYGVAPQRKNFNKGSRTIQVPVVEDSSEQLRILKALVIGVNLERQKYHIQKRALAGTVIQTKRLKRASVKECYKLSKDYEGISIKKIGLLFGRTPRTAVRYKNELKKLGLINCEHKYHVLQANTHAICLEGFKNKYEAKSYRVFFHPASKEIRYSLIDKISLSHLLVQSLNKIYVSNGI